MSLSEVNILKEEEEEDVREYNVDFCGIFYERRFTNIACLIIFIVIFVLDLILGTVSFAIGNPKILLHQMDSLGNLCGVNDQKERPYIFFFDLIQCAKLGDATGYLKCPTFHLCVKECPSVEWTFVELQKYEESNGRSAVKRQEQLLCVPSFDTSNLSKSVKELVTTKFCAPYYVKSEPVFGRCVPEFLVFQGGKENIPTNFSKQLFDATEDKISPSDLALGNAAMQQVNMRSNFAQLLFGDLHVFWPHILLLMVIAMLVILIISLLYSFFASLMVLLMLGCALFIFIALFAYSLYGYFVRATKTHLGQILFFTDPIEYLSLQEFWITLAIISAIFTIFSATIIVFFRNKIKIAIAIMDEIGRIVRSIFSLIFFPLLPFTLTLLLTGYYMGVTFYLGSTSSLIFKKFSLPANAPIATIDQIKGGRQLGQLPSGSVLEDCEFNYQTAIDNQCFFFAFSNRAWTYALQFFHALACLWIFTTLIAFTRMSLSSAFSMWFWAKNKPKDLQKFLAFRAGFIMVHYHIGTMALGSFLISLFMIPKYLTKCMYNQCSSEDHRRCKCLRKCCCGCFWCFEKFLRFINERAYINTAIYGSEFMVSAKSCYFLLFRNITRLSAYNNVTWIILLITKLIITVGTTFLAYLYFNHIKTNQYLFSYEFVPLLISAIGTYLISNIFLSVYSVAVEALYICVTEDLERNDGTEQKPYFMSRNLMRLLVINGINENRR
ncbi:hypothetical protein Ciccas_006779 [Cichlidogyrus casuarinus]|uniref:Choline transporter-like protein n=1 Tax=Cichlidogyrus casuarinus TaxID=1844966 RepID=A0ABD2Q4S6_9PLAT